MIIHHDRIMNMTRMNNHCWLALFASLGAIIGLSDAFGTSVVYGPGSNVLVLLTSKLAAKEGQESFCIVGPGQEAGARRLMYGAAGKDNEEDAADAGEDDERDEIFARPISSGDDMGCALARANALFLMCHDTPIEEATVNTLLDNAGSDLSKVVLLSKMGATAGGGGGFFGAGASALRDSEGVVRKLCQARGADLSIVRAGVLKGGGPGEPPGRDLGLSKEYYNTLFELSEAKCTMAHDRFTLGVDCTRGDAVEMPNALALLGTKISFDARPYDTNRINAAMACVMAAKHDRPVEFSIGSAKAEDVPSKEEWEEVMAKMEA